MKYIVHACKNMQSEKQKTPSSYVELLISLLKLMVGLRTTISLPLIRRKDEPKTGVL